MSNASETYSILHAPESGDFRLDNERGREFARRLVERMSEADTPFILGRVVQQMVEKGRFSGIEIGFFQSIAETAMTARALYHG